MKWGCFAALLGLCRVSFVCRSNLSLAAHPFNVDWVHNLIMEYQNALTVASSHSRSLNEVSSFRWMLPHLGQFQLDFDAGFDEQNESFSIEAIIQDDVGGIVDAIATKILHLRYVFGGELYAIVHGLLLCIQCDLSNAWVFFDLLDVVQAVSAPSKFCSMEDLLIEQIRNTIYGNGFP